MNNSKKVKSKNTDLIKAYATERAAKIAATRYRKSGKLLHEPFASFIVYRNKQIECYRLALKLQF